MVVGTHTGLQWPRAELAVSRVSAEAQIDIFPS